MPCEKFSCAALRTDDKSSETDAPDAFRFCHEYFFGLKTSEIWKTPELDRTKSTYFILPKAPSGYDVIKDNVSSRMIKPTRGDFAKFWLDELSDLHKDRYLLVAYMAVYNDGIRAIIQFLEPLKDLWNEHISYMSQLIRGFITEKNKSKFLRGDALSLLVNGHSGDDLFLILAPQLTVIKNSILNRLPASTCGRSKETLNMQLCMWIVKLLSHVMSGFVNTYFAWVSYDAQNLRRYAMELDRKGESVLGRLTADTRLNDQIDFMRKLKLAAPRWSQVDRRMMIEAIGTDGKSCRGTYVQILLNEVGADKFKKLVFGKQHFCAHCRRSSYTGEDRMLACKRCDTEGVRPRAWYCNRDCQKGNWRQHRANKHPEMVVELKADKKKKRKPRKK